MKKSRKHKVKSRNINQSRVITNNANDKNMRLSSVQELDEYDSLNEFNIRKRRMIKSRDDRLKEIEDQRRRSFRIARQAYLTDGRPATYTINKWRGESFKRTRIRFKEPMRTIICKRRKKRRRILFAINRVGHGRGGNRKPKWNWRSHIQC